MEDLRRIPDTGPQVKQVMGKLAKI